MFNKYVQGSQNMVTSSLVITEIWLVTNFTFGIHDWS